MSYILYESSYVPVKCACGCVRCDSVYECVWGVTVDVRVLLCPSKVCLWVCEV